MMGPGKAPDGVTPALDNDPSSPRGNCCGGSRAGPSRLCSRRQSGWPFRSESPRPSGNGMYRLTDLNIKKKYVGHTRVDINK